MHDCPICKTRHSEDPKVCERNRNEAIQKELSEIFEKLLKEWGDTPEIRLLIVNYTFGYMGASFGLHIS